jgi:ABC-type lipoprotein release transport system permease subunit
MVIVSSKVTSPKVLITVVIKIIMMIVMAMMIVIYCVMNNFLLMMHFVDKVWDVHPDVYAENENQD